MNDENPITMVEAKNGAYTYRRHDGITFHWSRMGYGYLTVEIDGVRADGEPHSINLRLPNELMLPQVVAYPRADAFALVRTTLEAVIDRAKRLLDANTQTLERINTLEGKAVSDGNP